MGGEVEGNKGCDNPKTDGTQRQPQPVGPDFARHHMKRRSDPRSHADVLPRTGIEQANRRRQDHHGGKSADAKIAVKHDTQRGADRHGDVGRHAVPRDHPRSVNRTDGFDPPQGRAGGGKTFPDAEENAPHQQRGNGQRRRGLQQDREQREETAEQAANNPPTDDFFRPPDIGVAARMRAADQG